MDPTQKTPPSNRRRDDTFSLNTTPQQYPQIDSPQGGFMNLLQEGSPISSPPLLQQNTPPFNPYQANPANVNQMFLHHQHAQFQQPAFVFQQSFPMSQPQPMSQPFTLSQPTPSRPSPTILDADDEDFTIMETQPPPPEKSKTKKKGKVVAAPKQRTCDKTDWTVQELKELASAWLAISEDKKKGNSQRVAQFWNKVTKTFNDAMGYEEGHPNWRNGNKITSKWRDIRLKVTEFCGIYQNLDGIRRQSGAGDIDVYNAALEQYKVSNENKSFPFSEVWMILKDKPKWHDTMEKYKHEGESGSKRSRDFEGSNSQQSDGRTFIDINDVPDDGPEPLIRPPGRNQSRKKQGTSASSESSIADVFVVKFDEYMQLQKTKAQKLSRVEEEIIDTQQATQMESYLRILKTNPNDYLGENIDIVNAMLASVREKFLKKHQPNQPK